MTQQSELNLQGIDFEEGYIAVIDKPLEWTSSDVVRKIKFALRLSLIHISEPTRPY